MTLFGAKEQVHYKPAVKVAIARVLCTRVRATIVFRQNLSKKTFLVRERVQSIDFEMQNFDFESAFAVLFESTTKPQREAQKCIFEGILCKISRKF